MPMQSHASVAEYIAAQPRNRQAILKKVRAETAEVLRLQNVA